MPQLMQQDAYKHQDGGRRTHGPVLRHGPVGKFGGKVARGQRPGEQHKDQEPRIIQPDRNSQNPSQRNGVSVHTRCSLCRHCGSNGSPIPRVSSPLSRLSRRHKLSNGCWFWRIRVLTRVPFRWALAIGRIQPGRLPATGAVSGLGVEGVKRLSRSSRILSQYGQRTWRPSGVV